MSEGAAPARFSSPGTMPRPYGYSQVVQVTGGHPVYISGQVPLDTNNQVVGVGDFAAQARQAFQNVQLALASFKSQFGFNVSGALAGATLVMLVPIVAFLVLQRQVIEGLTAGSAK